MAKFFRSTIFSKGLILIVIPLLFELTFGATMFCMQSYYRDVIAQETKAKAIIYHINEMFLFTSDVIVEKIEDQIFAQVHNDIKPELQRIQEEYTILKELIEGDHDPARLRQLKKIKRVAEMLITTGGEFERSQSVPTEGDIESGGIGVLKGRFSSFQQLQREMKAYGKLIRAFRQHDELKSRDAEKQVTVIQQNIEFVIVAAVIFSVLMNAGLFFYFMKGINRGILSLLENTKRMAHSEELLPPLTSDDEFGMLDRSFHNMAKAVESASQMKQEFFGMVSHDMRTPLTSIVTAIDCLLVGIAGELPEKAKEFLTMAEQSGQYLLNLMQDLLDIDRLSAGAFPLKPEEVDFADIFKHAKEMVAPLSSKLNVTVNVPEGSFVCQGDRDALTRVVVNLISNAIKFSPAGTSIDLSAEPGKEMMTVEIKDHGRGIPDNAIANVFDRFKQVEIGDAKKKGGTGLGLAICKGFVEAHAGEIGVRSKPGEGSTFWFRIPLKSVPLGAPATQPAH